MTEIVIRTAPIDSTTDIDLAVEQLTEIAEGDLTVSRVQRHRAARHATLTLVTSITPYRFCERLAASKHARLFAVLH